MNRNSPANSAPAISPALSVASPSNSGILRIRAQIISSTVARIERRPPCMTGEMSAAASFVTTLVKPQTKQHNTIVAKATESRGARFTCVGARDEGRGVKNFPETESQFYAVRDSRAFPLVPTASARSIPSSRLDEIGAQEIDKGANFSRCVARVRIHGMHAALRQRPARQQSHKAAGANIGVQHVLRQDRHAHAFAHECTQ